MLAYPRSVQACLPTRPVASHAVKCLLFSAAVVAFGGCKQSNRDAADIGPSSTARANTSGGGSTSDGRVSGATPLGQDLPQRETATRTGPGTPNPAHGGSTIGGATGKDASGNLAGARGPANTGTGTETTGASGGGTGATSGTSTSADMTSGSGSSPPATPAPGAPHVSASGATTTSGSGIPNAPGMAAAPKGRHGASDSAATPPR